MKALILSYHYLPENVPSALRMQYFQKYLPESGIGCRILSSSVTPWHEDPPDLPPSRDAIRTPAGGLHRGILRTGNRLASLATRYLGFSDYGASWRPYAIASAGEILREAPDTILFSSSPPLVAHRAAMQLKRRFGARWIADFQDPAAANPFTRQGSPGARWEATLEARILRHADKVIANTDTAADALRASYPQWQEKITHMFNGFDPEESCVPASLPLRTYRVLSHVGSVYGGRHPGILLAGLAHLIACGKLDPSRFKIACIGPLDEASMPDPALWQSLVAKGCIEIDRRYLPRQEALERASASDFLLLLDVNSLGTSLQVPSKLYDYLRIGRPILALTVRGSPVERILARGGVPYRCIYYRDASAEEAGAALLSLMGLDTSPVTASAWFWSEFDARNQTRTLAELMRSL